MLAKHLFPVPEHKSKRETFIKRMSENDRRAYINTQNSLIGWSVLDRVPSMTHPTLVVSSDQDYSPVAAKEAYAAMMPNARVAVLPDSRHAVPMEWPDKFNRLVLDFLLSQDGVP